MHTPIPNIMWVMHSSASCPYWEYKPASNWIALGPVFWSLEMHSDMKPPDSNRDLFSNLLRWFFDKTSVTSLSGMLLLRSFLDRAGFRLLESDFFISLTISCLTITNRFPLSNHRLPFRVEAFLEFTIVLIASSSKVQYIIDLSRCGIRIGMSFCSLTEARFLYRNSKQPAKLFRTQVSYSRWEAARVSDIQLTKTENLITCNSILNCFLL